MAPSRAPTELRTAALPRSSRPARVIARAAGAGIVLNADHDSVSSVKIDGFTYGLNFGDGVDFASVSNVSFTDNLVGIKKGTTADISHFSLTSSSITDGLIGIDFDKTHDGRARRRTALPIS